jgi:hypothetical protein
MYRIWTGSGSQARVAYYRCTGRGPARKGCGNMILAASADALVDEVMARLDRPVTEWRRVKGHNHDAELEDNRLALSDLVNQGLDDDTEDEARAALRAERKRLQSLPAVPDRWIPVETGETYASQWTALAPAARRAWLKRYAPRLYAGKPGMEAALFSDDDENTVTSPDDERATFHTGHGIVLTIAWKVQA